MSKVKEYSCKLLSFDVKDEGKYDDRKFVIYAFGIDEKRNVYTLRIADFKPFIYIKVEGDKLTWDKNTLNSFKEALINDLAERDVIIDDKQIEKLSHHRHQKLYGFDCNKEYDFVKIEFSNTRMYNVIKNIWYTEGKFTHRKLIKTRGKFGKYLNMACKKGEIEIHTQLYEGKLPPLLSAFHIQKISPTGWVRFNGKKIKNKPVNDHILYFDLKLKNIIPQPEKEASVPYKICSFDIEALSSHGDFPMAKKQYRKLATDIVEFWRVNEIKKKPLPEQPPIMKRIFETAFRIKGEPRPSSKYGKINKIYAKDKKKVKEDKTLINRIVTFFDRPIKDLLAKSSVYEKYLNELREDDYSKFCELLKDWHPKLPSTLKGKSTVYHLLCSQMNPVDKAQILARCMDFSKFESNWGKMEPTKKIKRKESPFPAVAGDKVSMIGSTFLNYGDEQPYLNHCVVLDGCEPFEDYDLEDVDNEKDLLLRWTELIQEEDPDIIIGYNIFGFDWDYMIQRADECGCLEEFRKLSRFTDQSCSIVKSTTKVASGTHKLTYMQIPGRIQIDLYNHFRKEFNLSSYKLDAVGSHFIGDKVKKYVIEGDKTKITCKNIMGLQNSNYVNFEIIAHSSDPFREGHKFIVSDVNKHENSFYIDEAVDFNTDNTIRWGLAKDDVSPQDIFKLSKGSDADRTIVAKYCVQDCNLVHHLLRKLDVITGFVEIGALCSVPLDFIILRGQGIKLLSFIAKKCKDNNTLMPVIESMTNDGSYEGAVVLPPKCGFYMDNPIACNDYSSLYPSSMISENISHDTKVWTKEYDLDGVLTKETGDEKYDKLDDYKYVDITYDTYQWIRPEAGKKEVKTKVGHKICRYAEPLSGEKGIMPSVLIELLSERKRVRSFIKFKTVTTKDGSEYSGLVSKSDDTTTIKLATGQKQCVNNDDIVNIRDTYDDFMKNVFDKRQLSCKVTANSLYGQCGARTSSFYDKDIAASTTATGRKLLHYAKHVVETTYADAICDTKYGKVRTNAEYIYGDTDSVFFTFNLKDLNGKKIRGKKALEITIELAKEAEELATAQLKRPHTLEYEKTLMPFLLLSKKRYVGMLYEENPNKCYRKDMGIVLKRRDNAPIVKDIYGGIIEKLMGGDSVDNVINYTKQFLKDIINGKFPLEKLIITKKLNAEYKNPDSIAHKVLADRMGRRDAGNKPATGSRIPFVFIETDGKSKLQGDKIEHPTYIRENNIKPDYAHYITNQIMKPVQQVFGLLLEQMSGFSTRLARFQLQMEQIKKCNDGDLEIYRLEREKITNKYVKELVFNESLKICNQRKIRNHGIKKFGWS